MTDLTPEQINIQKNAQKYQMGESMNDPGDDAQYFSDTTLSLLESLAKARIENKRLAKKKTMLVSALTKIKNLLKGMSSDPRDYKLNHLREQAHKPYYEIIDKALLESEGKDG